MLLDQIPFLCSFCFFCMWSKNFGGNWTRFMKDCVRAQASPTKHVQGWHHNSRWSKKKKKKRSVLLLWFLTLEGGEKWQVAVWSVCFIYMRNKNQSLSSIYSCCDINDAMHYSHTVCTLAFGGNCRVNTYSGINWRLSTKTSRKNTRNARCQRTLCS